MKQSRISLSCYTESERKQNKNPILFLGIIVLITLIFLIYIWIKPDFVWETLNIIVFIIFLISSLWLIISIYPYTQKPCQNKEVK